MQNSSIITIEMSALIQSLFYLISFLSNKGEINPVTVNLERKKHNNYIIKRYDY